MKNYQILDEPVKGAEWDLLGMAVYAERLAEYISQEEAQFTLGVYGQWGEGKTSFVRLLRDKLCVPVAEGEEKKVIFIEFSAWPYATADDLWRALIKKITVELCGEQKKAKPKDKGIRSKLTSDILTLAVRKNAPAEPPPGSTELQKKARSCQALRSWANEAADSGISKGSEEQLQINQEVAMMAMVRAGIEALGLVSPLVRSVQGFLGIKNEIDFTGIFQKEKNEVRQESINSIQRLVREGREVFDNIRGERRVYVFVDDLDRCLPDVALDLLEAIKNFLNVGLTFIVAADEALIGQGLRLRYKEMLNQNSGDVDKYIATKGREYFEKIIQFGVRVPPRTPEQAHRFIAAQFPQWQPATDIIQTALGTNPRRLKQYCNLLSYKRLVGDVPLSMRSQENLILSRPIGSPAQPQVLNVTGEWYEKLIAQIASCFSSTSMAEDMLGLFLDPRIRRWRSKLPDDPELSAEAYYRLIVDFLIDSYDDGGQSGLFPFLEVFEEKTLEGNCRDGIKLLLDDLLLMQDDGEVTNE